MLERIFFMPIHKGGKVIGWLWSVLSFLAIAVLVASFAIDMEGIESPLLWSILMAYFPLLFIGSVLLIVGIQKNSHVLLLPWLISFTVFLVTNYICIVYTFSFFISNGYELFELYELVGFSLLMAVGVYMYYGIFSLYKQFQRVIVATSEPKTSQPTYV